MKLRYYVLGSRGIGLSIVGLFACAVALVVGIGGYVFVTQDLNEQEIALMSLFLPEVLNSPEAALLPDMLKKFLLWMANADVKKLKSLFGLLWIGVGVSLFSAFILDFLLTYLIVLGINFIAGNKLTLGQQGRLLVFPWIIFTVICIALTLMQKMVLFWWFTLYLRIISPPVSIKNSVKPENLFTLLVPMWWVSLIVFVIFLIIYFVQAKGVSLYKERREVLFKKEK